MFAKSNLGSKTKIRERGSGYDVIRHPSKYHASIIPSKVPRKVPIQPSNLNLTRLNTLLDDLKELELDTTKTEASSTLSTTIDSQITDSLNLFSINLIESPHLIRSFFQTSTEDENEGGLSLESQGNVIHQVVRLESKIIEMISTYNSVISQIRDVTQEAESLQ